MKHTPRRIHHLNFLVRDLEAAIRDYERLRVGPFITDPLPTRGVRTARARLGESWLVLVQPTDQTSAPAQHLQAHGEGFFLLSLGVDNLPQTVQALGEDGVRFSSPQPRQGLLDWRVIDIDPTQTGGIQIQLATENTAETSE